MKPRVYIAGPISKGDLAANVNRATLAFLSLMRLGYAPLCPHWSCYAGGAIGTTRPFAFAEVQPAGTTHSDWMGVDLPWVAVADAVLRLPGESKGADAEVAEAHYRDIPVFESIAELNAYFLEEPDLRDKPKPRDPGPPKGLHECVYRVAPDGGPTNRPAEGYPSVPAVVGGVGRDAPTVTNERGARQSHVPYRCDLLPPLATLEVAAVLQHGAAKYGEDNWRGIPVGDHLNHAMTHVLAYLAGDGQDDHLSHAACRLLMALETELSADSPKPGPGAGGLRVAA